MNKVIVDTEQIAFKYLKEFGFVDEQILSLVEQGKKDLIKEMTNLREILSHDNVSYEAVNNSLHALKGLLFQIGNHKLAEKLVEIRSNLDDKSDLDEIARILSL